jgi:protein-S-isoprenylcysteine O-methyltransferase Ste14
MDSGMVFHAAVLDLRQGYIVPRSYCRLKARRASPEDQLPLKDTTESKLHLTLLGVCGLSADLLSIAWAINPKWLTWSNLSLPPWLRWLGVLGAVGAVWLGYSLLMVERSGHEGQMLIERFGDEYRACVPRRGRTTADAGNEPSP